MAQPRTQAAQQRELRERWRWCHAARRGVKQNGIVERRISPSAEKIDSIAGVQSQPRTRREAKVLAREHEDVLVDLDTGHATAWIVLCEVQWQGTATNAKEEQRA